MPNNKGQLDGKLNHDEKFVLMKLQINSGEFIFVYGFYLMIHVCCGGL